MKIKRTRDVSLNSDIVLISSLPDMGKVGGLVSKHLTGALCTTEYAKITIHDKPWVSQKSGIIDYQADEYGIFVNEKTGIVVFTGNGQPQDSSTVIELASTVLQTVQSIGHIRLVISAGGYLPNDQDSTDVFGIATDDKSLDMLKSYGVGVLDRQISSITWFNGLILGQAKNAGISGVGLFGKIEDSDTPQYGAASNIVTKIADMLGTSIDTTELDCKIVKHAVVEEKTSPGIG